MGRVKTRTRNNVKKREESRDDEGRGGERRNPHGGSGERGSVTPSVRHSVRPALVRPSIRPRPAFQFCVPRTLHTSRTLLRRSYNGAPINSTLASSFAPLKTSVVSGDWKAGPTNMTGKFGMIRHILICHLRTRRIASPVVHCGAVPLRHFQTSNLPPNIVCAPVPSSPPYDPPPPHAKQRKKQCPFPPFRIFPLHPLTRMLVVVVSLLRHLHRDETETNLLWLFGDKERRATSTSKTAAGTAP